MRSSVARWYRIDPFACGSLAARSVLPGSEPVPEGLLTPTTMITRALVRGASSVLACEVALSRGELSAAVCHLSDLREALAEVERLAGVPTRETAELLKQQNLIVLRNAERKLGRRCAELAAGAERDGVQLERAE